MEIVTTIDQITEEADVGFGLLLQPLRRQGRHRRSGPGAGHRGRTGAAIDHATADIGHPGPEVVAIAHRSLIAWATNDRELAWLLVRPKRQPRRNPHDARLDTPHATSNEESTPRRFSVDDRNIALISPPAAH